MAFRDVFQQTQIGFIENETSLPRALLPGELSSGCETERLDKGRLSRERNNASAALYNPSPTSSLRSMPPPLVGEALAFRDVFQQAPVGFIENKTSLPRALPLGELARQRLRGQARQNKIRKHSDTMSLTNRACIAVFFAFCQHPCPLRHGFAVPPLPK